MGLGYWCFAANVCLTIFQSRLVQVPKPQWHLWKFLATGAAALTVGTVQGVIQVQPANADWLYKAGHAGEWIDPISHAHINLVTGLTMLVAGALFALLPVAPSRKLVNWPSLPALRIACVLRDRALSRVPRGAARLPRADAGAGRGGDAAPSLPDHDGGNCDVRRVLAAVLGDRPIRRHVRGPLRPFILAGCAALLSGRCRGRSGVPGGERAARSRRRSRRRDRQPHAQLNMLAG
jgi:F0F1-type ATP synthase membrane subunit c/vacuolar-type H+-ATPase subunit K